MTNTQKSAGTYGTDAHLRITPSKSDLPQLFLPLSNGEGAGGEALPYCNPAHFKYFVAKATHASGTQVETVLYLPRFDNGLSYVSIL